MATQTFTSNGIGINKPYPPQKTPISEGDKTLPIKMYEQKPLTNLNAPGVKDDSGKSRTGLMVSGFANALASVSEVTSYGAAKYSPNGWITVPSADIRYTDALFRHLLNYMSGEKFDSESNLRHITHAAWNILAILELQLREELKNAPKN